MAKRLILLRHARISPAHVGRLVGATDAALAPEGLVQARGVAAQVTRWAPQACFCSPLLRCRQTALATVPHLPPQFDPDLREIDFGQWEGLAFAEAARDDPAAVERWAAFEPDFAFPGGESVGQFLGRVHAAAERLAQAEAQTVLAVTHGGVARAMICHLLGLPPRRYVAFGIPYAALAVIDLFDGHGDQGGQGVLAALERPDDGENGRG